MGMKNQISKTGVVGLVALAAAGAVCCALPLVATALFTTGAAGWLLARGSLLAIPVMALAVGLWWWRFRRSSMKPIPVLGRSDGLEGLLRTEAFRLLLRRGSPVEVDELGVLARGKRSEVEAGLASLDRAGRIRRDDDGRVVASAGLSVVPSRHEISLGGRRYWTWCAYDALGILGSLGRGGTLSTQSPQSGDHLDIEFEGASPLRTDLVLLMADSSNCHSTFEDWCPQVNLFESHEAARQWMRDNQVQGELLSVAEATRRGIQDWRSLVGANG